MLKKYITKIIIIIIISVIIFINTFTISLAHPGRTDSNGGHYDRSTGEYHYHNGGSAGRYTLYDFTDSSNETISFTDKWKLENYDKLQDEINNYKEDLKKTGFNSIREINDKLEEKESEISALWFWGILTFIIGICISYNVGLNKK